MASPIDLKRPITELVHEVSAGTVTAVDLVRAALARIDETSSTHAILELNPHALRDAAEIDKRVAKGEKLRLAGIPFIAKDNFLTRGTHTTAASRILEPYEAVYEGKAIKELRAAGAVLIAKSNLDAFAHGSSTENSDFGPTKNPLDETRVPGGSSGGSAAAVALGQACFATGTDTGGSVRQPASFCGVVGFMGTYGLISRSGIIAMGSSFDTVGAFTNSVTDLSLIVDIAAGIDPADSTTIEREKSYLLTSDTPSLKGKKFGLIKEYIGKGTDEGVKQRVLSARSQLESMGATVEEVSIPTVDLALAAYYILVPAEISSNLARYDGVRYGYSSKNATNLEETYRFSREEGFGPEAKRRIMIGTYVLSSGYYDAYYKRAQKVRTLLIQEFDKAFKKFDFLLGPVSPTPPFKIGERSKDPLEMYLEDICTVAAKLVGSPGISVPAGTVDGLPVGLQIISPQKGELGLLEAARAFESVRDRA
jgi:aspartyl-tRNA(Asn)/glutamyl-tRNA(Gln) amidotransferase subunit A